MHDNCPTIVIVIPGLGAGGTERVATFVSSVLAARGDKVTILSCESPSAVPYYEPAVGVHIEYLDMPVGRSRGVGALLDVFRRGARIRRAITMLSPDLVISFLTRMNVITLLASRGLRVPVVISERNNPQLQNPGPVWNTLRNLTYPGAASLVTITRGALDCFGPAIRRRGSVIPNFAIAENGSNNDPHVPLILSAVGRLVDQKGFDLLISAYALVWDRHPDWVLRIWGEGPDEAALRNLVVAKGLESRVEFAGTSEQPGQWIERADAFVLSSRYEGWGLVLGEAMAGGLPCISFDCEFGPAEMITPDVDGILVLNGSVEKLASAMDVLMGDAGMRRRLGEAARQKMQRFNPDAIGKLWAATIDRALTEG